MKWSFSGEGERTATERRVGEKEKRGPSPISSSYCPLPPFLRMSFYTHVPSMNLLLNGAFLCQKNFQVDICLHKNRFF